MTTTTDPSFGKLPEANSSRWAIFAVIPPAVASLATFSANALQVPALDPADELEPVHDGLPNRTVMTGPPDLAEAVDPSVATALAAGAPLTPRDRPKSRSFRTLACIKKPFGLMVNADRISSS